MNKIIFLASFFTIMSSAIASQADNFVGHLKVTHEFSVERSQYHSSQIILDQERWGRAKLQEECSAIKGLKFDVTYHNLYKDPNTIKISSWEVMQKYTLTLEADCYKN